MKRIIDIDDKRIKGIKLLAKEQDIETPYPTLEQIIANGIPLPKGHGRLIDEERISLSGIHFETERDHAMMIGRLNSAPTIIEADKEESENK